MWRKLIALIIMMALILWVALCAFEYVALDADRYSAYQRQLDLYSYVGVAESELVDVQRAMAEALKTGTLENVEVTMFGERRPVFNEREMAHMDDVLRLFALERALRNGLIIFIVAICVALVICRLRRPKQARVPLKRFGLTGLWALIAWAGLAVLIAVICGFDFEAAFTRFHLLLFTNDLWLLDPRTDAMIRMYPQEFFMWIARDIGLYTGGAAIITALLPLTLKLWGRSDDR